MQCAHDNQEDLTWAVTWVKRIKGKESTNEFGQCGAMQSND